MKDVVETTKTFPHTTGKTKSNNCSSFFKELSSMRKLAKFLISIVIVTSCTNHVSKRSIKSEDSQDSSLALENYRMVRSVFDPSFTEHFPDRIAREGSINSSEDTREPYVGITMIEFNLDPPITNFPSSSEIDAKCVILFSKIATLKELPGDCSALVIPVIENPRFKGFNNGFKFFSVLQPDSKMVQKYSLSPNSTSIKSLKHGISKGIAYNSFDRVAVYWSIIW